MDLELGRHQHIVTLARAWRLTGDRRFADAAVRQIDGFLAQCPPGVGIHWRSGLELGIRLISWAWTVELLRGSGVLTNKTTEPSHKNEDFLCMSCTSAGEHWGAGGRAGRQGLPR